jgi:hypothetical protein
MAVNEPRSNSWNHQDRSRRPSATLPSVQGAARVVVRRAVSLALVTFLCLACASMNDRPTPHTKTQIEYKGPRYNSLDLSALPCEPPGTQFFFPIEFDRMGQPAFDPNLTAFAKYVENWPPQHIFVFVHGWNKTPAVAEAEYQQFICRVHTHLVRDMSVSKSILIVGIFWPSSAAQNYPDLTVIKPFTYPVIRKRADDMASTDRGFPLVMRRLTERFRKLDSMSKPTLSVIGHSFGGRMIARSFPAFYCNSGKDRETLESLPTLRLILVQAAIASADAPIACPREQRLPQNMHVFNILSREDYSNRYLYPFGSAVYRGPNDTAVCAVGACGIRPHPTVNVLADGTLETPLDLSDPIVNFDATRIIFSHSDIFKGRVAQLISCLSLVVRPEAGATGSLPTDPNSQRMRNMKCQGRE